MKRTLFLAGVVATMLVCGPAAAADGQAVFNKTCKGCHTALKPKIGDKAAWAPLSAQGVDTRTAVVMKGKSPMPPRGGAANEAEVKAAIQYIISKSK